jgi:two-component system, OmpR family, sensor histidine kinase KdpD
LNRSSGSQPSALEVNRRVLIAIAPEEQLNTAERLMNVANRYAKAINAPWTIASAETPTRRFQHFRRYAAAFGLTGLCTLIAWPMRNRFELIDIVMVYLLGTTLAALRIGRGPAVLTSVMNIAAFDYFFVPPRFTFRVADSHYLLTFGVMLGVALIIADLVSAVRLQTVAAAAREGRTAALYAMTRELAVTRDAATMAEIAERHISDATQCTVAVLVCHGSGNLYPAGSAEREAANSTICAWVMQHQKRAGFGSEAFGNEPCIYLPLIGSKDGHGVLVVGPLAPGTTLIAEQNRLLENLVSQLAQGIERVRLGEHAEAANLSAERAALRNTLLASISHDLRTPLAAIAGAGSMMFQDGFPMDEHRRATLGHLIEDKARDMTELLSNVLDLVRLESGPGSLKCEWHSLEDLIGLALRRNADRLIGWDIVVDLPSDFPMLLVEAGLIVQLLSNLVDNCAKYAASGKRVIIAARQVDKFVTVSVEDNGSGLPPGNPERLFDKFERGASESNIAGVGLGLAICRAVARLHGGDIQAARAAAGGARFEIILPATQTPDEPMADPDD